MIYLVFNTFSCISKEFLYKDKIIKIVIKCISAPLLLIYTINTSMIAQNDRFNVSYNIILKNVKKQLNGCHGNLK